MPDVYLWAGERFQAGKPGRHNPGKVYASKLRCTSDETDSSLPFHRFRVEDLCHGGEMGAFAYALAAEIKSRVGTQFNQRYPTRSIQIGRWYLVSPRYGLCSCNVFLQ